MSYQVIARKWRPQKFDEVVFQDHVSKTLKNSINNHRISHAYIFSGPRGVGKTTMARILAKSLNCIEGPTHAPCGVCDNCVEIKNGTSFDVIEIDGASNRGIEDIRELRENVNFAPVKSKYKVYIIDEVHMLTQAAFNALLKTLEEPPPHVIFIFATTEIHQIPDTILSRCQKFFFKKIPIESIVSHLGHIVEKEGYKISGKALYPIARAAGGSMRDAQSFLDQVISFSGQTSVDTIEINEEDTLAILGIVPIESYITQLHNIIEGNAGSVIIEVNRIMTMGVDIIRYAAGFIDIIRSVRLVKNGISVKELLGFSEGEIELLTKLADGFHDEELSAVFKIANELQSDFRYSNNERVNLEMALLDMIAVKQTPSLADIISKLEATGNDTGSRSTPTGTSKKKLNTEQPLSSTISEKTDQVKLDKPVSPILHEGLLTEQALKSAWSEFLISINEDKQYLHFILRPSKISLKGREVRLAYPGGGDHTYYHRILDSKNLTFVKEEMGKRLGMEISITVDIDRNVDQDATQQPGSAESGKDTGAHLSSIEKEQGAVIEAKIVPNEEEIIPLPDDEMLKNPELEEYKPNNPTIDKIKEFFHGQIINKGDK